MNMDITNVWIDTHLPGMHGWCDPDKGKRLAELIVKHNCHNILELGIFGGRSLLSMAKVCEQRGSGLVTGIDPWSASASLEGTNDPQNNEWWQKLEYEEIYRSFVGLVLAHHLTKYCRWFRCKSAEAAAFYKPESIDLIHQDSNHSEEVSCAEIELFHPLLKPKAIFVMDDVRWETTSKARELLNIKGYVRLEDHGDWQVFQKGMA